MKIGLGSKDPSMWGWVGTSDTVRSGGGLTRAGRVVFRTVTSHVQGDVRGRPDTDRVALDVGVDTVRPSPIRVRPSGV